MIPGRLQYFLEHFETTKNATKYGPSDPVCITRILKNIGTIWEHPWNIFFISENLKIWFVGRYACLTFGSCIFHFVNNARFWNLKIGNMNIKNTYIENFRICSFQIGSCSNWNIETGKFNTRIIAKLVLYKMFMHYCVGITLRTFNKYFSI